MHSHAYFALEPRATGSETRASCVIEKKVLLSFSTFWTTEGRIWQTKIHETLVIEEGWLRCQWTWIFTEIPSCWVTRPSIKTPVWSCLINLWIFPDRVFRLWTVVLTAVPLRAQAAETKGRAHTSVWDLLTKTKRKRKASSTFPNWGPRNIPPQGCLLTGAGGWARLCTTQNRPQESLRPDSYLAFTQQSPNIPATPFCSSIVINIPPVPQALLVRSVLLDSQPQVLWVIILWLHQE